MTLKTLRINKFNNMKKSYISPLMSEVIVEAEPILAGSLSLDGGKSVDTSTEGGQLSGGHRGQWGNLWS